MLFTAYLIKGNSSAGMNLSLVGIIVCMLSIFFWAFEVTETVAMFFTVGGMAMFIVGTVMSQGKRLYEVDVEAITIDEQNIQIRSEVYPINNIEQLTFYYHSFYSQSPYGYFTEHSGLIEYGMLNRISFKSNGNQVEEKFYLSNQTHADSFFSMINALKQIGIRHSYSSKMHSR